MQYIHHYTDKDSFINDYCGEKYSEPWVSLTEELSKVNYNITDKERYLLYLGTYLTFNVTSSGTIYWKSNNTNFSRTIEYRKNGGEWTEITNGSSTPSIDVVSGDTVQFRGNNDTYGSSTTIFNTFSGTTCQFNVCGNIMSLVSSSNFDTIDTLSSAYTFYHLFANCKKINSAEDLVLPANNLTEYCYGGLFSKSSGLTTSPKILPAMNLASNCYYEMFYSCTALTTTPQLPAETMVDRCYFCMFQKCTNLVTPPELPSTTLATGCYWRMFSECSKLATAPELPATVMFTSCYTNMFLKCGSLTAAPNLPATTLADSCYETMFSGCSSLTQVQQELPATTLYYRCYFGMFRGTKITTAPDLPATSLANNCYYEMFYDCTNLNHIKCLAKDNFSATNCVTRWMTNVSASVTFIKNPNATSWASGANGIPSGWSVQDA